MKDRLAEAVARLNPDLPQSAVDEVVNQFSVAGTKQACRPDVVVFVNGLPLPVVELKNPADESADKERFMWGIRSRTKTIG